MAATAEPVSTPAIRLADHSPAVLAAIAFAILFSKPAVLLVRDWWNDPDAGHGLLLAPSLSGWRGVADWSGPGRAGKQGPDSHWGGAAPLPVGTRRRNYSPCACRY